MVSESKEWVTTLKVLIAGTRGSNKKYKAIRKGARDIYLRVYFVLKE